MPSPSLSTGMMIESFDMTMISAEPVPASAGSDMMNCRLTSGNNELKVHTVRYLRGRSTQSDVISFRRFSQRAPATRSLAGGASVAVAGDPDRIAGDLGVQQVRQVYVLACTVL